MTDVGKQPDLIVEVASDEDIEIAIARALKSAGVSAQELKAQARSGCFSSEQARHAWFAISHFLDLGEESAK
jgi:RES domain-containing protein